MVGLWGRLLTVLIGGLTAGTVLAAPGAVRDEPLTLEHAIRIALESNPGVAARASEAEAATARLERASAERRPEVRVEASYSRHLDPQRLLPVGQPGDPAALSRDIVIGDLVVSMPLFTGGRLRHRELASELLHEAARRRLAHSRDELVYDVSAVFFSMLAQRRVVESLEFSGQTLEEHLRRTRALVEAEKVAGVDSLRAEVRLADVRQRSVDERNLLAIQGRILANLLGLPSAVGGDSVVGQLELAQDLTVPGSEEALERAWASRDDYLAARAAVEAQARNVRVAAAARWPTVSLHGAYGARWGVGSLRGAGEEIGDVGRILVGVEAPLLDGGRVAAEAAEQRALLAAEQQWLRSLELEIRLEVETALSDVASARERVAALRASIDQARESLRIERRKYELGKGTVVDVLDAQSALLETETTYAGILAELRIDLARVELVTGGR